MLDLSQPWVIQAALVISALTLFDVLLYLLCARLERRRWTRDAASALVSKGNAPAIPN